MGTTLVVRYKGLKVFIRQSRMGIGLVAGYLHLFATINRTAYLSALLASGIRASAIYPVLK